jgi:hypothetical protein
MSADYEDEVLTLKAADGTDQWVVRHWREGIVAA